MSDTKFVGNVILRTILFYYGQLPNARKIKNSVSEQIKRFICWERYFANYPFLLWLAPKCQRNKKLSESTNKAVFCRVPGKYNLYLYPDSLGSWFIVFSVVIGACSITINMLWVPIFIVGYALSFFMLYHVLRLPCIPSLIPELPRRLEEWILGYIERIDIDNGDIELLQKSQNSADVRLRTILTAKVVTNKLRPRKERQYINRLGSYHPQEWLLRIAITDFFQRTTNAIPSVKLKVFIYWGAPVWIGYLLLLLSLLVYLKGCANEYFEPDQVGLIITLLVWALLSTIFALIQTKGIAPMILGNSLDRSELDALPITFQRLFSTATENTEQKIPNYKYFDNLFTKWVIIINTFASGIYIALMTTKI